MQLFDALLFIVAAASGAIASVTGFGIGSILTPLLALKAGTKLAVALVAIPHLVATVIRFWLIRSHLNRRVFISFGIASAIGGLIGSILHLYFESALLTLILGILLLFAGFTGFTGLAQKMRFHGGVAQIAGVFSGIFGGLVGNQGGIRSAALQNYQISKEELIATGTVVGIVVDLARMPIYLFSEHDEITASWIWISIATIGVIAGTFLGMSFLKQISETMFRKLLGVFIFMLGIYMVLKGLGF